MKTRKALRTGGLLAVLGMLLTAVPRTASGQQIIWPLEESKNRTSGFCDPRSAHYHGGIDISTGGLEGLKVRAADSGYVYRISTSWWGMGKVLYIKMANGRIAVYAHLSQFATPIRRYVEAQQYSLRRYNTNLFPLPDELPVRRGEIVGFTGQTGAGSPHLHFEIRTAANFPIDPLTADLKYADRTPPEFQGVLVRPLLTLDPRANVENAPEAVYLKVVKASASGRYRIQKPLRVSGAVGLAVRCGDPTGYKANMVAPHRVVVTVNGARWFEVTHDSLDYDLNRQVDLAYDFAWEAAHGEKLLALYRHPANQLPWYDPKLGGGVLNSAQPGSPIVAGENRVEILAYDAAGNEATLEITLVFNRPPEARDVGIRESGGQWHLAGKTGDADGYVAGLVLYRKAEVSTPWIVVWEKRDSIASETFDYVIPGSFAPGDRLKAMVIDNQGAESMLCLEVPGALASNLKPQTEMEIPVRGDFVPGGLILRPLPKGGTISPRQLALRVSSADSLPSDWAYYIDARELTRAAGGGEVGKFPLDRDPLRTVLRWESEASPAGQDDGGTVLSADSLAAARFKPGDLYDPGFFRVIAFVIPREIKPKPASKIYSFEPASVPFARKAKVGISYADVAGRVDDLALYVLSDDGKSWAYLGRDVDPDAKIMTAAVLSFGSYALVADTTPPAISAVVPSKDARVTDARPEITCMIRDDLSGIGSDTDIEILLDGEWLIPEYDPETLKLKTRPRTDLALGKHKLEITARDRVGHQDYFIRSFTVVKKSG